MDFYRLAASLAFQAPIICFIVCTYVFFALRRNGITQKQFILLRVLTVSCVLLMGSELVAGMIYNGLLDWHIYGVGIFYALSYIFLLCNTAALSELCLSFLNNPPKLLCKIIRVVYVLTGLLVFARLVLIDTQLFTYYGENDTVLFGPLDDAQTWGYLLIDVLLLIAVLIKYFDKNDFIFREKYEKALHAAVIATVVMVAYALFYIPYINWIGHMIIIMYLFTNVQGLLIDRDELTSLNNRRRLLKDIEEKSNSNAQWSYILIDVNNFKQVNDTYGHNEGDRAIVIVAETLNEEAMKNSSKAYRVGGDEFAVLTPFRRREDCNELCETVNNRLEQLSKDLKLQYKLSISYGHAYSGENSLAEIRDIMNMADERMYHYKTEFKKNRNK